MRRLKAKNQPPIQNRLPPDVHLHRLRYDAARAQAWRALLSEDERARLDGYGVEKRRREFLMGRVVARRLLAEVLACAPQDVPLTVAEDGAPDVPGSDWCVSISHAEDEAAAVAARRAVGVDLEPVRARRERLHRFLLSEAERPLLDRIPMTETEAFILCWTLKEAALKALRCGLRRSPKIVRLTEVDAETGTAHLDTEADGSFDAQFERDGKLWLAVAYEANGKS